MTQTQECILVKHTHAYPLQVAAARLLSLINIVIVRLQQTAIPTPIAPRIDPDSRAQTSYSVYECTSVDMALDTLQVCANR